MSNTNYDHTIYTYICMYVYLTILLYCIALNVKFQHLITPDLIKPLLSLNTMEQMNAPYWVVPELQSWMLRESARHDKTRLIIRKGSKTKQKEKNNFTGEDESNNV